MKMLIAALVAAVLMLGGAAPPVQAQCCVAAQKAPAGKQDKPGVYVWGVGSFEPATAKVTRTVAKGRVMDDEELKGVAVALDREEPRKKNAGGELDRLLRKGKKYSSTEKGIVLRPNEMLLAVTKQRFNVEFAGTEQDNTKGMFDPKEGIDTYGERVFHTHKAANDNLRRKVRFSGRLKADGSIVIDAIDASNHHEEEVRHLFIRIVGTTLLKEVDDDKFQIFCDTGDQKVPLPTPDAPKERLEKLAGRKIVADGTLAHDRPGKSFGLQIIRPQGDKDEIPLPEDDEDDADKLKELRRLDARNRNVDRPRRPDRIPHRPVRPHMKRDPGGLFGVADPDIRPMGPDGIRREYVPGLLP